MNIVITYIILGTTGIVLYVRAEYRQLKRAGINPSLSGLLAARAQAAQFRRDLKAGVAADGGRDKLDALIEATRERERRGWPPLPTEDPWGFWENDIAGGSGL